MRDVCFASRRLNEKDNGLVRILHVIHGLRRGGLENGVINLLNGLPADEFKQAVCCLDERGDMADRLVRDIPLWVLDRKRHDLSVPIRLARHIRQWRPDIVHCRNWNTWLDTVLGARLAGVPQRLVWSFHGFAEGRFPFRRRVASGVLARLTDHMFAVCQDSAERFAALTDIDPRRFDVVYNGVDTRRYRPAEHRDVLRRRLGFRENDLVLLTVASLTPVKDHAGLLIAASLLRKRTVLPFRLLFVGDGPLRSELARRVDELGLAGHVELLGPSDGIPDLLGGADVFVLPSHLEGMSNAILEAMATGLPVVARSVGGNEELVVHGETGLLCKAVDPVSMAEALGRLLDNAALRRRMGAAAGVDPSSTTTIWKSRRDCFPKLLKACLSSSGRLYVGTTTDNETS